MHFLHVFFCCFLFSKAIDENYPESLKDTLVMSKLELCKDMSKFDLFELNEDIRFREHPLTSLAEYYRRVYEDLNDLDIPVAQYVNFFNALEVLLCFVFESVFFLLVFLT